MNYNNVIEDEIVSIEEHEIIDTIDIEVDSKNRLFFANDILTHNSGWEGTDLSITSIAESAGLLHTVDLLFGIITTAEMKARGEYFLKCLANRVAGYENTKKRYTIEWKYARIEEDRNSPIMDMDYVINNVVAGQKHPRGYKATTATIDSVISNSVVPLEPVPDNISIRDNSINITGKSLFNMK
jgi:hypothetical protein